MKITTSKILHQFFEEFAWEDYDRQENDGEVDHEGLMCKLCSTVFDYKLKNQRDMQAEHLFSLHKQEVRDFKLGSQG